MVAPPPATRCLSDRLPDAAGLRLAVVGADGFLGSHVVRVALAAGAAVEAVLLQEPWRLADLDDGRLTRTLARRERLGRPDAVPALDRPDAVVWLAYVPPRPGAGALAHERADNTASALHAAALGRPVVFASSADVYGPNVVGAATESRPAVPVSPYAIAKREAEEALAAAGPVLRIATAYGPGENGPRAIPSFIRALSAARPAVVHGDGSDVRDYVRVGDVAAALVAAAVAPEPGLFNVGSGRGRTTLEVLAAVAAALGVEPTVEYVPARGAVSRLVLDTTRLRSSLGIEPGVAFEEAVAEEVAWLVRALAGLLPSRGR
ncbi:MAG: NAD-dependent epimerase/dehydratase family protein [Gaiellaceae bacterium]